MMRKVAQSSLPITAKDIAREVGLSQATVSRILADVDGFHVTPETRKRVVETAFRMDYRPNALARSLRQRRTNVIGFYTDDHYLGANNSFLSTIIGGVQRAADAYDLDILLYRGDPTGSCESLCRKLMDRRIDGLLVHSSESTPLVAHLRKAALPVVAITDAIPGIPSVVCDDAAGMRLLVDYLWSKGHRRIAFVRTTKPYSSVETRQDAFLSEMRSRGAGPEDTEVISIEMQQPDCVLPYLQRLASPPTAVCCWNDMTAYNLLHACRVAGISVPSDLAVVGYDGFFDPKMMIWPLVTISASWDRVASQAMHTLRQIISDGHIANTGIELTEIRQEAPLITRLPVQLVGGTTA